MAYLRGATCIWSDGERIHLWSEDGLDRWRDTSFGQHPEASGLALREAVPDHFVCMRFAQGERPPRPHSGQSVICPSHLALRPSS